MTHTLHGLTFDTEDDAREFWAAVKAKNRQARAKAQSMPKCGICRQPMWLSQRLWNAGTHRTCHDHRSTT